MMPSASASEVFGLKNFTPAFASASCDAPTWLLELRKAGAARLTEEGLPTRSLEAWKYTNLAPLTDGIWEAAESFAKDEMPARNLFPVYSGARSGEIILLNGSLISEWSSYEGVAALAGVRVRMASELDSAPIVTGSGASAVRSGGLPLHASLNAGLLRDVVVIDIDAGAVFKEPLVISSFTFGTESLTKWSAAAPRVVVNIGARAEVAIVEMSAGQGRTIHVPVTALNVSAGARVSHARVQVNHAAGVQLGYTTIALKRDSFCETYQFTLGGRISREDLDVQLLEPGAEIVLDGLYLADGKRHVDHSTNVEHVAHHTTSSQLYKGILNDESRAVFNGCVHIHRDAQQSNAAQLNNNLLLSKRAEIDTKPELEIDADDVKASHGATIGQIDPEHIFYLRARAIPEAQAIKMLSKGFAQDVAFRIQNEAIRTAVEKVVAAMLAKTEGANA